MNKFKQGLRFKTLVNLIFAVLFIALGCAAIGLFNNAGLAKANTGTNILPKHRNLSAARYDKPLPDLVVSTIEVKTSISKQGKKISLTFAVKNQGNAMSKPSKTKIEFSALKGSSVTQQVPKLLPGASYTRTVEYMISKDGRFDFKATADYDKKIPETNEMNNQKTITFSIGAGF